jgi:hypothetical protein
MADTDPRDRFDDWFDEPEAVDEWSSRVDRVARDREAARDADDWTAEPAVTAPSRRRGGPSPLLLLLLAALAIGLLLGILAAAGVFSSSPEPRALPTTTAGPPPTGATTTTTATTTAASISVPTAALEPGATGAAVRQLQRALAAAGYSTGTIDGSYGPATKAAVTRFQQAHGLTADGVAGPKTLTALAASLRSG